MTARTAAAALAALVLTGCAAAAAGAPRPVLAVLMPDAPAPHPSPHRAVLPPAAPPSAVPARPAPRRPAVAPPLLVTRLAGVGDAGQVVSVTAAGYGTTWATLQAFARTPAGWRRVLGPWPARIGRGGFAPPGAKREGDGRTPSGSYGFGYAFGVQPDPGTRLGYRHVDGPWVVWDDDRASPSYNLWVDRRRTDPGRAPEPMDVQPAYSYGAVIAYNTARTPGLGSAIFLHVLHTGATAGCVALPADRLLAVLRWLDPAQRPRIVMGPLGAVTR